VQVQDNGQVESIRTVGLLISLGWDWNTILLHSDRRALREEKEYGWVIVPRGVRSRKALSWTTLYAPRIAFHNLKITSLHPVRRDRFAVQDSG